MFDQRWSSSGGGGGAVRREVPSAQTLLIGEGCAQRMAELVKQDKELEANDATVLHLQVEAGGCEGFQYQFALRPRSAVLAEARDDDEFIEIPCGTDAKSLDLVRGSKIDYVQEMIRSAFVVAANPNADSSCGCGHSFNLKV
jgi:iron-sulfur cluster assembly accessory protein